MKRIRSAFKSSATAIRNPQSAVDPGPLRANAPTCPPRMTTIAFLGLGAIGAPMARHLPTKGFALTVWNRTRERAMEFAAVARVARTPAGAARDADVIITCLPTSREVEALLAGDDGLIAGF